MIRIRYRWTIEPGTDQQFIRDWKEGTRRIQANCAGAFGSFLIRDQNNPNIFFGIARWESNEAYFTALNTMRRLNLPGRMPETFEFYDEVADIPSHHQS